MAQVASRRTEIPSVRQTWMSSHQVAADQGITVLFNGSVPSAMSWRASEYVSFQFRLNGNSSVIPNLQAIRGPGYGSLMAFGMTCNRVQRDCVSICRNRPVSGPNRRALILGVLLPASYHLPALRFGCVGCRRSYAPRWFPAPASCVSCAVSRQLAISQCKSSCSAARRWRYWNSNPSLRNRRGTHRRPVSARLASVPISRAPTCTSEDGTGGLHGR